jgi:hypothetical protein
MGQGNLSPALSLSLFLSFSLSLFLSFSLSLFLSFSLALLLSCSLALLLSCSLALLLSCSLALLLSCSSSGFGARHMVSCATALSCYGPHTSFISNYLNTISLGTIRPVHSLSTLPCCLMDLLPEYSSWLSTPLVELSITSLVKIRVDCSFDFTSVLHPSRWSQSNMNLCLRVRNLRHVHMIPGTFRVFSQGRTIYVCFLSDKQQPLFPSGTHDTSTATYQRQRSCHQGPEFRK